MCDGSAAELATVEAAWRRCLEDIGIANAKMLRQSNYGAGRRTFVHLGRIYKIELLAIPPEPGRMYGDVLNEYEILSLCQGVGNVPRPLSTASTKEYRVGVYERIEGRPLPEVPIGAFRCISVVLRTALTATKLTWLGIAHNDLMLHNLFRGRDGQTYLLDFDKAEQTSRAVALYRNFLRRRRGGMFHSSMVTLTREAVVSAMPHRLVRVLRKVLRRERKPAFPGPQAEGSGATASGDQ